MAGKDVWLIASGTEIALPDGFEVPFSRTAQYFDSGYRGAGYLYTGDSTDAASHAWVDAWLGADIGWQSIDVTHRRPALRNYCRLAVGRDYLDAAPVRGVRHGGGGERMEANVLVADSAQQQQ